MWSKGWEQEDEQNLRQNALVIEIISMKNEVDWLTQEQKEKISSKGEVINIPVCEEAAITFINFFI